MLFGPSRKKFLGDICSLIATDERDLATIACVTVGVLGGANIVRDLSYVLYESLLCLCGSHLYHKVFYHFFLKRICELGN